MPTHIDTGKQLKLIETDDINKVPFTAGQYIIVDGGMVYYDPTNGLNLDDRVCLTPKQEVDVYTRTDDNNDEYYLSLHTKPIIGDLVIIKDLIANTDKCSNTVYIYNNNEEDTNVAEWCKLVDSYNAKNIYLTKDIDVTSMGDNNRLIDAAGKNIEDVLNDILSPEISPSVILPTINLTFPSAGAHEIGSIVTPTYHMELNPGSYEYGPNTNIEATSYNAISSNGSNRITQSGTFPAIVIDESTNFYMSASITYSDGEIPLTNKGNNYESGIIKAGGVSVESSHITGFVNGLFYGGSQQDIIDSSNISGEFIKTLNKSGKAYTTENVDMIISPGTKSIIIACPANEIGLKKVYNNTVCCDMTSAFNKISEIPVNFNDVSDDYTKHYTVWVYTPAEAYEIETNLTISLA